MGTYRLRVSLTYSNTGNARKALKAINGVLGDSGRAEAATRSGAAVALLIPGGLTECEAATLADALVDATDVGAKFGKIATVRTP